jgi:hypothetical protein
VVRQRSRASPWRRSALHWFTIPDRRDWLERRFAMPLEEAAGPFGRFVHFALELGDEALAVARA